MHEARMVPICQAIGEDDHVIAILGDTSVSIVEDVGIRSRISRRPENIHA